MEAPAIPSGEISSKLTGWRGAEGVRFPPMISERETGKMGAIREAPPTSASGRVLRKHECLIHFIQHPKIPHGCPAIF